MLLDSFIYGYGWSVFMWSVLFFYCRSRTYISYHWMKFSANKEILRKILLNIFRTCNKCNTVINSISWILCLCSVCSFISFDCLIVSSRRYVSLTKWNVYNHMYKLCTNTLFHKNMFIVSQQCLFWFWFVSWVFYSSMCNRMSITMGRWIIPLPCVPYIVFVPRDLILIFVVLIYLVLKSLIISSRSLRTKFATLK